MRNILLLLLLSGIPCFAQEKPEAPRPRVDKKWLAFSIVSHASAAWDTEETIALKPNLWEHDPLVRPIANLPNPAYRATTQAMCFGLDFVSFKMKTSRHAWMRKTWWLPQAVQISGNVSGAIYSRLHH